MAIYIVTRSVYCVAVSSWYGHRRSPPSAGQQPKKDFVALNKLAAQSGLTTVHEQSQFRACNDIRVREKEVKGRDSASRAYNEDTTFGIATRLAKSRKAANSSHAALIIVGLPLLCTNCWKTAIRSDGCRRRELSRRKRDRRSVEG